MPLIFLISYLPQIYCHGSPQMDLLKTINHIVLTKHHQKTVQRMWHMVNRCKEMEQNNTKKVTRHFGQPYLLSNPDELNILADAMK